ANRPAKNINSLDSHTIVPTLTMLGRVSECTLLDSNPGVVAVDVTIALCPVRPGLSRRGAGHVAPLAGVDTIGASRTRRGLEWLRNPIT
ncbi:MAG TPA: hypothetical protein VGG23_01275, partial [Acidimicrobiales bacterium]